MKFLTNYCRKMDTGTFDLFQAPLFVYHLDRGYEKLGPTHEPDIREWEL